MFTQATFDFLQDLRDHNDKSWFDANKARYETVAKGPLSDFVRAMGPAIRSISGHYLADDRSAFRIHRDTRFSKDKSPYKTHLAAQFRHEAVRGPLSETVHAPGFYCHISPEGLGEMDGCFGGFGTWRPEGPALAAIRARIVSHPDDWAAARDTVSLGGESLKRVPAGFDAEHRFADDLRRKDYIGSITFEPAEVMGASFVDRFADACRKAAPLNRFLCNAVGLPW